MIYVFFLIDDKKYFYEEEFWAIFLWKNIYILFHTFNFQIYTSNGIRYIDSDTLLLIVGKLLLSSLLFAYTGLNCLKAIAIRDNSKIT